MVMLQRLGAGARGVLYVLAVVGSVPCPAPRRLLAIRWALDEEGDMQVR